MSRIVRQPKHLSLWLLLPIAAWLNAASMHAQPARVTLPGHVPPAVARLIPQGRVPATKRIQLAIGLPLRNEDALDQLLNDIYDPRSPNFHKYLDPSEFTDRFGPTAADYDTVISFAKANGLSVSATHGNRVVLDIEGPATAIERAFGVTLRTYKHPTEAREFFAPDTDPSVPADVPVRDMWGLSDFSRPRPLSHKANPPNMVPMSGTGPGGAYRGTDFRNAYVPGTSLLGSGQTAAVVEFDGYYLADITNYEAQCGYTNVPLTNVLINGVTGAPGYSGIANAVAEVSLDIELLIAIAPGLARLIVYEGNNAYDVLSKIATDNTAKEISCSWSFGVGPTHKWKITNGSTLDSLLKQMGTQGQSFFQASGDSDAYTGAEAVDATSGPIPVDSIYVTSVGGTTLSMNGAGASWSSETVWNWGNNVGSGGGISPNYIRPSWQSNVSMTANSGSTANRNFPDVALTADAIHVVYNNGSSAAFGGTSCAAPLWAGFCALVNQQSLANGGTVVGFLNPALYTIAASPAYTNCFHDITTGNNIGTNTPGLFIAVTNYDLATGLGSPTGTNLINALAPLNAPYIVTHPFSQTATNGANISLAAAAAGASPLSYRWLLNGTNLPSGGNVTGTTSNVLSITSATTNNTGNYQLVATNTFGAATSSVAVVSIGFAPDFSAQPSSLTVISGSNAVFDATVTGSSPVAFQWQRSGTNLLNGGGISGANSNTLTLTAVTTNSNGSYRLTVTNSFGKSTSSVATLTVVLPPSISGPVAQTIECGSNAAFSASASGTAPLAFQWSVDGSVIAGATNTTLAVTNVHLPNHNITLVVTNLYGSATSSVALIVHDTQAPAITLNGANLILLELGSSYSEPGASALDLCAGTVAVTITGNVNTNAVSTNVLTYGAADGNGNSNSITRTVIVRDTTAPAITWSFTNMIVAADANCSARMPDVAGTNFIIASDLSGTVTISQTPTNNAVLALGTNIVVITVRDSSSNAAFSTNFIVVRDQTPPVMALNGGSSIFVELGTSFVDPGATATDSCAGTLAVVAAGAVNTNVVGTNVINYSAVDPSGNSNGISRTVIVRDTTPPAITWAFTNLILVANANCAAQMPDITTTNYVLVTDRSAPVALSQSPTNLAVLPLGTNPVVLAAIDPYGNTVRATNFIVVRDQTPPTITLAGGNPLFAELGTTFSDPGATATDACAGVVAVVISNAPNMSVPGTNSIVYTSEDGNGNRASATRIVIVRDTTAPTISWSFTNLTLTAGTNCGAPMPDVTGTNYILASDASAAFSISQTPTNNSLLALGTNVVVLTVQDASSNTAYSTNIIVVRDTTPPVVLLHGVSPLFVELGSAFVDPGADAFDACAGAIGVITTGTVNTTVLGTNVVIYAANDGHGNSNSVTRTVIVRDTAAPTIVWSFTNLTLVAGSDCGAFMPDVTGTNYFVASDTSGALTISQTPTNNSLLALGTNVVVLTARDASGNAAFSTNVIVVRDQTPPTIALNGAATMFVELGSGFTEPGASATDSCAGAVSVVATGVVNTNSVGTNVITYSALDPSGNSNSISRTVIVRDTTPPAIMWAFTNLILAADTNCTAQMPDVTGTNFVLVTDRSAPIALSQFPTNEAMLLPGTNAVVLTATDAWGNTARATNFIVVRDQTPPTITLAGPNPLFLELGTAFVDPGAEAFDACSGAFGVITSGTVNTNAVGTNLLTYVATDGNGNSNRTMRAVIVRDTTAPIVVWNSANVLLSAGSNCGALMPDLTGTNYILTSDSSGAVTISQTPSNNAVLGLGTNVVVITVRDPFNNSVFVTNAVIVLDDTPPLITLRGANPLFVELGNTFTDPGADAVDGCAGIVATVSTGNVNVGRVGTNTIFYSAMDPAGNSNGVARTVIVRDTTPPAIVWTFTNLTLAVGTNCTAEVPDLTGTNFILAADLSAVTISQEPTNHAPLPLGTNFVVLTARDSSGNTASTTNVIIVHDEAPPILLAQPRSQTNTVGSSASFSVAASACTPLSYQWLFDNAPLAGQTNSTLFFSAVASTNSGIYAAVVGSEGGFVTSIVATLTVQLLPSSLSVQSSAPVSAYNEPVSFAVTMAPADAAGTIQFFTNGVPFDAQPLISGQASSASVSLPRGATVVTAIYSGSASVLPATNTTTQIVTNHPPTARPSSFSGIAHQVLRIPVADLATNWIDLDGDIVSLVSYSVSSNGVTLTNDTAALYYYSSNRVVDQFVCTLADGWGGTNYQTVQLTLEPPVDPTPNIVGVATTTQGGLRLSLSGASGYTYVLETTTNLGSFSSWQSLATNVLGTNGLWQFTQEDAAQSPHRFYRLKLAP